MLTYSASNTVCGGKPWSDLTPSEKVSSVVVLLLIIVLIVWAWVRALNCSSKSPDSRAIHLLFATVDPILYLIFSYFIEGMC